MKFGRFIAMASCTLALAGTAHAQLREIPGLGLGAPSSSQSDATNIASVEPGTAAIYSGRIVVNFNISIQSVVPAGYRIACGVSAFVDGGEESAGVYATRNANTATCTVTIPYSFQLSTRLSNEVQISYGLNIGTLTTSSRISDHLIATISLPANGATTTENVNATL